MPDGIRTFLSGGLPPAAKLIKQLNYGTAVGLTRTAKEGQAAVQGALRGKFTIRNRWLDNSPIAIKITPATQATQFAEVYTKAPFMQRQDEGGEKIPYKNYLAVPVIGGARPSKGALIPKRNLPANLQNAFVIVTKQGKRLLCIRKGKAGRRSRKNRGTDGIVVMYFLEKAVKVKKADVFLQPIQKVVDRRLLANVSEEVDKAIAAMR